MADIRSKTCEIYSLEQLSAKKTFIHRLHPVVKIITTFVFIVSVVSFNRYSLIAMIPYVFYTAIIMAAGEIPFGMIFRRTAIALPFCLFAGISNIIFDRDVIFSIGYLTVTTGLLSCVVILFRTYLCVSAVLILVSVTPFSQLAGQLRRMHIPGIMVTMFEMIYRYVGVLLQEAATMNIAYKLRSADKRGIQMRDMGTFAGQLLIRSFDRSERIYYAMVCRNYKTAQINMPRKKLSAWDVGYTIIITFLCVVFRFMNPLILFIRWTGGNFS